MKSLFTAFFILVSVAGFGQKTVSLWEFSHANKTIQVGDSAFVRIGYQSSYFSSTDTLKIRIDNVVNGNVKYYTLAKIPFTVLDTYPRDNDKTVTVKFAITKDVVGETELLITALSGNPPTFTIIEKVLGLDHPEQSGVFYTYFDLYGTEIKNPVNGVYIYRTDKGETGKIFIP